MFSISLSCTTVADCHNLIGLSQYGVAIDCSPPEPSSPLARAFSSVRVLVENVIAKIKDWRAAKDRIRTAPTHLDHVLQQHQKIWTIVSVLVNDYK